MSNRLFAIVFTVPAKTLATAPFTQAVTLEDNQLDKIRIIVPPGHIGLTGLRVTHSGTQVLPYNPGGWITTDNDKFEWPYDAEIQEFALVLAGYNTDSRAHTFFVWFYISDLAQAAPVSISSPQAAGASTGTGAALADLGAASSGGTGTPPDLTGGGTPAPTPPPQVFKTVTVPRSETLAALGKALRWKPAYLAEVEAMNGITATTKLVKGAKLNLPVK